MYSQYLHDSHLILNWEDWYSDAHRVHGLCREQTTSELPLHHRVQKRERGRESTERAERKFACKVRACLWRTAKWQWERKLQIRRKKRYSRRSIAEMRKMVRGNARTTVQDCTSYSVTFTCTCTGECRSQENERTVSSRERERESDCTIENISSWQCIVE